MDVQAANEIFAEAVRLTDKYAQALLARQGMTWGPRYVRAVARLPQQEELFEATLGFPQEWDPAWGDDEVDFGPIARNKLAQALRAGASGRAKWELPWFLERGDYLAAGGVATTDRGVAVGVSGAYGLVDEAIAMVLLSTICQLYRIRLDRLEAAGASRV
jgi:hypothetical protein